MNLNNNLFWAIFGRAIAIIALLLLNSLVAKNLNIEDFAFFNLIMSIIPSFFMFLAFGQDVTSSKFLPSNKKKNFHIRNVLKIFFLILTILSIPLIVFFNDFIHFFRDNISLFFSVIFIVLFSSILRIISDYFRATNRFKYFILFNSTRSSGGVVIWGLLLLQIFLLLFLKQFSLENIFYSYALSSFLTLLIILLIKRYSLFSLTFKNKFAFTENGNFKKFFKSSLFIASSSLLIMIKSDHDFWIVSAFGSANELAFYAPIIKIAVLVMVPLSIFESFMPKNISNFYHNNDKMILERYIRSINTYMFYSSFVLLILLFFFSKSILLILFGETFVHLDFLLKCVILSFLPKIICGPCGPILVLTRFEKINLLVNFIFLLLSIIIGVFLTMQFGFQGMIYTYIIGMILINITFYIIVIKKLKINTLPYFNFLKADFSMINK